MFVPNMIVKQKSPLWILNEVAKLLKAPLNAKCQPDNAEREKKMPAKKC